VNRLLPQITTARPPSKIHLAWSRRASRSSASSGPSTASVERFENPDVAGELFRAGRFAGFALPDARDPRFERVRPFDRRGPAMALLEVSIGCGLGARQKFPIAIEEGLALHGKESSPADCPPADPPAAGTVDSSPMTSFENLVEKRVLSSFRREHDLSRTKKPPRAVTHAVLLRGGGRRHFKSPPARVVASLAAGWREDGLAP
jgi:hypothetical protein